MLADDRTLLETVATEPGGIEKSFRCLCFADERVVIGADPVVAPPARANLQVEQRRCPVESGRSERLERRFSASYQQAIAFPVEVESGGEINDEGSSAGKGSCPSVSQTYRFSASTGSSKPTVAASWRLQTPVVRTT